MTQDAAVSPVVLPRERLAGGFYRLLETDLASIDACRDALAKVRQGSLHAVLIKGFLAPGSLGDLIPKLERTDLRRHPFSPASPQYSLGQVLQHAAPDLADYFSDGPKLNRFLEALFPARPTVQERLLEAFSSLGGGCRAEVPTGPQGQAYVVATLRRMQGGSNSLPPHCEMEQFAQPGYSQLGGLIDRSSVMSYFIPLSETDAGGELVLYDAKLREGAMMRPQDPKEILWKALEPRSKAVLKPSPGDMILFDGGLRFHAVARVKGVRDRWTLGGFIARRNDGQGLYVWS